VPAVSTGYRPGCGSTRAYTHRSCASWTCSRSHPATWPCQARRIAESRMAWHAPATRTRLPVRPSRRIVMGIVPRQAPEWRVAQWFNASPSLTLESLRGKLVVLEAFQMLCPGCVSHGLPQAKRVRETFPSDRVAVVGLHTVFEHHDAMRPEALRAFLHEYGIQFPVGIDQPGEHGPIPQTMQAY